MAGISLPPSLTFLLHQDPLSLFFEMPATQAIKVMSFYLFTRLHCLIYIKQFAYFGGFS